MADKILPVTQNHQTKAELSIALGFVAVVLFFLITGAVSYWNTHILSRNAEDVTQTHKVILALNDLLALMKDTETGQRGYLITGDEKYLEPYWAALARIDERVSDVERMTQGDSEQQARVQSIRNHMHAKLDELNETIVLRRTQGFDVARGVVITDRGKNEMDVVRAQVGLMQQQEERIRTQRVAEMDAAYRVAVISGIIACLLGMLLSGVVAYLVRQASVARRYQQWMQAGEAGLSTAMLGEQRMEQLGENILKFLAEFLGAHAGAIFIKNGQGFRRVATYGVPKNGKVPERFEAGDGLLGQAAKDMCPFYVKDVPDNYLTIGSALGQGNPKHLVISPAAVDGAANAVFELGFIKPLDSSVIELLNQVSEYIGVAIRSATYRANLQNLLEETQRQAEELQTQSEELRVSNEELEEQSRMLKQSQVNLEQQQAELQQTNAQLEEQTQLLEDQRDDLARAKTTVQLKAQELERASQYKSDFLANMSHELRTPLNSSLILSKLLADNPQGNLTEEQVKFSKTIHSSGNDLLALIGDILDLSKIEAGHMEVRPEPVLLKSLANDLKRTFETVAQQKGLIFQTNIESGCAATVHTDRQRLEQILRNLLSNAIKFTEQGSIELNISRTSDGQMAFAVTDSGIGIAEDQQETIFEAFRQADGTISRKYGGTGLGLSISRELTRLLAGNIQVKSEPSKGSTFTITIPEVYDPRLVTPRMHIIHAGSAEESSPMPSDRKAIQATTSSARLAPKNISSIDDDRGQLTNTRRVILVVEDDNSFARILYDMAHELDFQCLVAATADEALAIAKQYVPNAIVLDIGLPDHSGLTVLDRLKHDARTRHIPVHVVSAGDYMQTALSLGAVGYMLKPVKREELAVALKHLETRLAQHMRRILIVEDDLVQRESMSILLSSQDVETVEAGTAAECLGYLKEATFDCMVLDLSLPDSSGYKLLETLSQEDAYSFPPVIVYTGRELSGDEEQRLRRYSKSIIIKGAKSPERLLDEVTLFLHQVVADLPQEQQRMLEKARSRDAMLEGRRILIVEDDVRNVYSLTSILEPRGANVQIARNGREALEVLEKCMADSSEAIDLVLMDVMMPEMDGLTATREIRKRPEWRKLPVIMLTAKAMKDDQEKCLDAGANDYMAKPLDVEKLLSLVRVWMPR